MDLTAPQPDNRGEDLNWLLHRAAQKLNATAQEVAAKHGISSRGQVILTALVSHGCARTQLSLGHMLGLDKTTLTAELDRLERAGLVERKPDPNDRRVRTPSITEQGRALQQEVAVVHGAAEAEFTADLSPIEANLLKALLYRLISAERGTPDSGSCL
ncbi:MULTISPECIES: MarR family winged helix-turn-helix transcriptional regulator [Actinosynnema]|uniref:MarR family winged helix-turn-helix transcriptional regulator n=1 Tax=Actinosynnema TaxID=40566 RepID=UPI0020A28A3E|nr:MarR family transcriptional regulator [Actinosynnema pretiosum]MCP2092866.1 DNA-binding transcriptional regulator, MarR family [Actinosynnema pretiosum]